MILIEIPVIIMTRDKHAFADSNTIIIIHIPINSTSGHRPLLLPISSLMFGKTVKRLAKASMLGNYYWLLETLADYRKTAIIIFELQFMMVSILVRPGTVWPMSTQYHGIYLIKPSTFSLKLWELHYDNQTAKLMFPNLLFQVCPVSLNQPIGDGNIRRVSKWFALF